jgi:radical SAM superfamily enzyme YgiQ (UPF0313 family)
MNEKVDVLFMPAPLQFRRGDNYVQKGDETSTPPIGIMYIATYLNSKGYNCKILDIGLKSMSLQETIAYIRKINPRVVGISILTSSVATAVSLAKEIKKTLPHIIVGCGGTHVCVDPTFIQRYPYFDFGVKGEGELIMVEIMKKLDNGEKISGLYDGGYIKDLDSIPFPDYNLVDFKEYGYPLDKIGKRHSAIAMITSRGCPFACSFCCKSESRKYVRFRSVKNIVDEIEKNYSISRGEYSFLDDTMTLNQKNVAALCKEIIKKKLKISWVAMARADTFNLELALQMKKAGCRELFIGVESGDERIRNEIIKKKVSDKTIFEAIRICRKVGIRSSIFLMLGFPEEGKKEVERTVKYPFISKADIMGIHLTMPLPGSELYEQAIEEGIIPYNLVDLYASGKLGEDFSSWHRYVPKGLTLEYLEKARARSIRKFYLSFSFIFRLLLYYIRFPNRIKYDKHMYRSAMVILFSGKSKVQWS